MANCGCGCTPVRVTMMGGRGPAGPPGEPGPPGDAGEWSAEAQAQAQGFWLIASPEPPEETEMYGVPVVWVDTSPQLEEVPVLPYQPSWRDSTSEAVIPTLVGVNYRMNGSIVTGTLSFTPPETVTITAEAKPGYYMTGTYSWTHSFPDPSLVTLLASEGFSGDDGDILTGRELDNYDGGSGTLEWEVLDSNPAYTIVDGEAFQILETTNRVMLVETGSESGIRVEFDLIAPTDANAEMSLEVGGTSSVNAFARIMFASGQIRKYARYDETTPEKAPRITGQNLGTYAIQIFGETVTFEIPGHPTATYDLDSDFGDLVRLSSSLPAGSSATEPGGIDNLKIYQIG